jgi:hypothetical protein
MDVVRKLRRLLRPVRGHARRARVRWGDLGALLAVPNVRPEDIRWVARKAQARGDTALAKEALLALVGVRAATEDEERLLRRLSEPLPTAPAEPAGRPDEPAGAGAQLVITRDPADGHPIGRLANLDGQSPGDTPVVSAWQQQWSRLPRSLGDQLAVCTLTRVAHLNGVVLVRSGDPSTGALASAVAQAVGARSEQEMEVSRA